MNPKQYTDEDRDYFHAQEASHMQEWEHHEKTCRKYRVGLGTANPEPCDMCDYHARQARHWRGRLIEAQAR